MVFVDKRSGWLKNLHVGSLVYVKHKDTYIKGSVSLVTALGVLLIRCDNQLKFKIMPDGFTATKESELVPYGKTE
jgi:hypothetical protein